MEDRVKALIQLHLFPGESLPKWQHVTWTVDISDHLFTLQNDSGSHD